jgi:hypothetical protein
MGLRALHRWSFEAAGEKTVVRTVETWDGPLARVLRRPLQKTLTNAVRGGLSALKGEAERRAAP